MAKNIKNKLSIFKKYTIFNQLYISKLFNPINAKFKLKKLVLLKQLKRFDFQELIRFS